MYKEIIKPALILFLICVVMTGTLAYVNGITKPIIDENNRLAEQESLMLVTSQYLLECILSYPYTLLFITYTQVPYF